MLCENSKPSRAHSDRRTVYRDIGKLLVSQSSPEMLGPTWARSSGYDRMEK